MSRNQLLKILILATLVATGVFTQVAINQKKENVALKLKIKQMQDKQKRKKAISWSYFLKNDKAIDVLNQKLSSNNKEQQEKTVTSSQEISKTAGPPKLEEMTTSDLTSKLDSEMQQIRSLSPEKLDQSLMMVDELIAREPNLYSAYKAKLFLLLTSENKFNNADVSDQSINELLDSMSEFDTSSDEILRKEAFLIAQKNNEAREIEEKLNEVGEQLVQIEQQLEQTDESSQEYAALLATREALALDQENFYQQINSIEQEVEEGLLSSDDYLNEDIIQIPFLRSLSKGSYQETIDNANELLSQYPDSVTGHYFLIQALKLSGRNDEISDVISNANLSNEQLKQLQRKLQQSFEPGSYWKKLKF